MRRLTRQLIQSGMPYTLTEQQLDRFWLSVPKSEGCWEWAGNMWRTGYGRFSINGHYVAAHRVSWELMNGPIPDGLWIDHLCRNRRCVNPSHLEPVTPGENQRRGYEAGGRKPNMSQKGKVAGSSLIHKQKTHCPQGHPYAGEHLYVDSKGHRHCKTCRRARQTQGRG